MSGLPADKKRRPPRYRVPAGTAQSELVIKNSTFLGTIAHAPSVTAARSFIEEMGKAHADASHNAWAFKITSGPQEIIGSSDDGEPGGTAGRPILAVIEGSGLCEIVAVVTRYFGGVKLGTGGLVRAYSAAVRETLKRLDTSERVLHYMARISIEYGLYSNLKHLLPGQGVRIEEETYTNTVTLVLAVPYDRTEETGNLLRELTNGRIKLDEQWFQDRYL